MKLDRNSNPDGMGKYALVLMREIPQDEHGREEVYAALDILNHAGCLDYGEALDNEFMVIRLKDKFAAPALHAYANAAANAGELEWAVEIRTLAVKAENHPRQKQPD